MNKEINKSTEKQEAAEFFAKNGLTIDKQDLESIPEACSICERKVEKNEAGEFDGHEIATKVFPLCSWDNMIFFEGRELKMDLYCCKTCCKNIREKIIEPNTQDVVNKYNEGQQHHKKEINKIKEKVVFGMMEHTVVMQEAFGTAKR